MCNNSLRRDHTAGLIAAAGGGALTPLQKRALAVAARHAYEEQRALGLADEPFDTWRHAAVQDVAPGARGLRSLVQSDYAAALSYFQELAGGAQAHPDEEREKDDARRARFVLHRAAEKAGVGPDALAALFFDLHRTREEDSTARQIWHVLFTLKHRESAAAWRVGKG